MKKLTAFFFLLLLVSCQGEQTSTAKNSEPVKEEAKQAKSESQEDCADEDEIEKKVFAKDKESSSSGSPESLSLEGGGESGCTLDESI